MYYTYMLRCQDNTIYTGIAKDLNHRMEEHFLQTEQCAKYTKVHQAKKLEAVWQSETRSLASKLEYQLKTLTKSKKEKLIKQIETLNILLGERIETEEYQRIDIKEGKNTSFNSQGMVVSSK